MTSDGKPAKPASQPHGRTKKSETLEVRIPHETKQAFLNACREDGTTASEVVRDQVQSYLDQRARPSQQEEGRSNIMNFSPTIRRYGPRIAAGSIAAIGLTALAVLPSAAAPDFKAQFSRLDANGDGALSVEEFLGPKEDDAAVKQDRKVIIESHVTSSDDDAKPHLSISPSAQMKQDAFTFWLPEEFGDTSTAGKVEDQKHEYKFISRSEVKDLKVDGAELDPAKHVMTFSIDDMRKEEFASIDANKDGKVSLDEYKARQTAMLTRGFEILDTNSDNGLSKDEYAKITTPVMIKVKVDGGPDTPEPPKIDIPGMKQPSAEAVTAAFTRLDTNKDGKLSLQEYLPKG